MKVKDSNGQTWRVTRRWVPWRRKLKGAMQMLPDLPVGMIDDGPLAVIGLILLMLFLFPFLVIAFVASVELLFLLLIFPFALLARVLFGTHWTVEVREGFSPFYEMQSGSWSESGHKIREIAAAIERDALPPRNIES